MGDGRRNRGTARHAGIVLYKRKNPSGAIVWRAYHVDPDTKQKVHEKLPDAYASTEDTRRVWAIDRADALASRAKDLKDGTAIPKKGIPLEDLTRDFYGAHLALRERTKAVYQLGTDAMLEWAKAKGVRLADDLRPEHLAELRDHLANKSKMRQEAGSTRAYKASKSLRSPVTVNRELRPIKTMLRWALGRRLVPFLNLGDILVNLKNLKQPKPLPEFLKKIELGRLVSAGRRHDEDMFALTRKEKEAGLTTGSTPRHPAVMPFLAVTLLTGMRFDEARALRWEAVDLDAEPAGTITLGVRDVKTAHARTIDLSVSPLLKTLLATMKLKAGDAVHVFGDAVENDPEAGEERTVPGLTRPALEAARKRLSKKYGAPKFSWQLLRSTCGTYLVNAPGIFGAPGVSGATIATFREAKQLGHSVTVAEKHYLGVVHVAPTARTLERAMGIRKRLRRALGLPVKAKGEARTGTA